MKIVMIAPFAIYPKSTVRVRILPIAKTLVKWGYNVTIVIPPHDNVSHSGIEYELEGVKICNVQFGDFRLIKYILTPLRMLRRVMRLKPDVVYIFKPKAYSGLVAMFLAMAKQFRFLTGMKLVLDMDDWEGYGGFNDYYLAISAYPKISLDFFDFQERWIPKHMDTITVASKTLSDRASEFGVSRERIFYLPNGTFQERAVINSENVAALRRRLSLDDTLVILLYTRFFEYSLDKVIELLKYIKDESSHAKLLVVGKGDLGEENELMSLAMEGGVNNLIHFAGWIKTTELNDYLALGDVAIYPFDDTPLNRAKCPRKLVELMLSGRCIVADRVGQIAEYIENGKSGILVDPDNTKEFALATIRLLKNEFLRKKLGRNAQRRILCFFNWERLVHKAEEAILYTAS